MKSLLKIIIALLVLIGIFSTVLLTQEKSEKEFYSKIILDSIEVTVSPNFRPWPGDTVTQSEFSLDVHPQNENILFLSANTTDWPCSTIYGTGVYWSFDGGLNWQGHDDPPYGRTGVDPAAVIGVNGNFYINYINTPSDGNQGIAFSTDNGANWTRDSVAISIPGCFMDKNHLTIDKTSGSPYGDRLYCGWVASQCAPPNTNEIMVSYSTDYGYTWSGPTNISQGLNVGKGTWGVNLQTAANGFVYAAFAIFENTSDNIEDAIGFSKSPNGGIHWTAARAFTHANFGIFGKLKSSQINVNSYPSMAVDRSGGPYNGNIYICWTQKSASPAGSDPDIVVIKSTDDGITWTSPVRVNDDPVNNGKDQYFPWITVDQSTGNVMMVFYDNRETTDDSTGVWMAVSTDGGSTWQNIKVSDTFFQPKPITGAWNANYQGDYIGIAALNNIAYPVWADDRTGNYQAWMSIVRFGSATSIESPDEKTPHEFVLNQNYPNPFNPSTTISFTVPKTSIVEIVIYDELGKKIKTLHNSTVSAGNKNIIWNGTNESGQLVSSGVYFYTFTAKSLDGSKVLFSESSKLLLFK